MTQVCDSFDISSCGTKAHYNNAGLLGSCQHLRGVVLAVDVGCWVVWCGVVWSGGVVWCGVVVWCEEQSTPTTVITIITALTDTQADVTCEIS